MQQSVLELVEWGGEGPEDGLERRMKRMKPPIYANVMYVRTYYTGT